MMGTSRNVAKSSLRRSLAALQERDHPSPASPLPICGLALRPLREIRGCIDSSGLSVLRALTRSLYFLISHFLYGACGYPLKKLS
jgi:hypothetical protein